MQIFDDTGRFLLSLATSATIAANSGCLPAFSSAEDDTIYVADSYNQRVQVFRYIGGPR